MIDHNTVLSKTNPTTVTPNARSLRDAARDAHPKNRRAHNPAIFYNVDTGEFSFGPNFPECVEDGDRLFVDESDLSTFVENWFGNGSPSRFRVCDAQNCIDQCELPTVEQDEE